MHTAIGDVMPVMAGQVNILAEEFPTLSKQITAIQESLRVCYALISFVSGLSIGVIER
jgi:hypothetical protein